MGYRDENLGSKLSPNSPAWPGGAGSFRGPGPLGTSPTAVGAGPALDKKKTASYMDKQAHGTGEFTGKCAAACRLGLEAGGLNSAGHPGLAKEWSGFLKGLGVPVVARNSLDAYTRQQGDVAVFEGGGRDRSGHMEIFDGLQWVSDTRQPNFMPRHDYPGGFVIFRFRDK